MFKRILKWLLAITTLLVVLIAIFLVNLIWFRPWSLNLFYDKVFAEALFHEPELLSSLGLVEQFGITGHNAKLSDESPAHAREGAARMRKDLAQLHEYSLDRQSPSQRLSTRVLDWFLQRQVEGEQFQFYNYPVNQLFGVQNQFPSFMANTHRLLDAARLRLLSRPAPRAAPEIRPDARGPAPARADGDHPAAFCGGGSVKGNAGLCRAAARG